MYQNSPCPDVTSFSRPSAVFTTPHTSDPGVPGGEAHWKDRPSADTDWMIPQGAPPMVAEGAPQSKRSPAMVTVLTPASRLLWGPTPTTVALATVVVGDGQPRQQHPIHFQAVAADT